jgi:hypothetical protein
MAWERGAGAEGVSVDYAPRAARLLDVPVHLDYRDLLARPGVNVADVVVRTIC